MSTPPDDMPQLPPLRVPLRWRVNEWLDVNPWVTNPWVLAALWAAGVTVVWAS